jgi:hypothetical protein
MCTCIQIPQLDHSAAASTSFEENKKELKKSKSYYHQAGVSVLMTTTIHTPPAPGIPGEYDGRDRSIMYTYEINHEKFLVHIFNLGETTNHETNWSLRFYK